MYIIIFNCLKKNPLNNFKKIKINYEKTNKKFFLRLKFKKNKKNVNTNFFSDKDPLICKEYKILGICAYGNACKFIHDRKVMTYCNTKY